MARTLLWLALLCAALAFCTRAAGLRLELTHVDAKQNCSTEERMRRATERTHRRLASMGEASAPVHWAESQYIAEYLIGDPPQQAEAIIDTGSNLIWTQCSTCQPAGCFSQNLSFYDPSRSRTARPVACNDTACALGSETRCARDNKACAVLTAYGAGVIGGVLGTEAFTFQPQSENVSLAFGCIAATRLTPGSLDGASGIIGLGRGNLSLVSQLGDNKFSYCLTPYFSQSTNTSRLFVGASAGLSSGGAPATSVPFLKNPDVDPFSTFYYLPLTGITVGDAKLAVPEAAFDLRQVATGLWAGTLIDSGSPFTSLVDVAYQALRDELVQQLGASIVPPPAGAEGLDLCAAVAHGDVGKLVPPLVLHFGSGGGDVAVPPENYWGPVDDSTACMVVFSSGGPNSTLPMNETTIIGNYMQQDMHLLYDLEKGMLSFQPADCSSM
ncbi:aspartic proteinase nepenthesin-1 [Zea mays]|jgi:hypothetical protein|uniref:Eukaryotic aspartyl protease family protein n=1 Tax=Zea mays TaxID=4577 RepID=A0A1D6MWX9_MAIZE|nr:aspartic proteinase nepenthesin-1 [Zea mays]ONM33262.1 Eukaryotic aspartyl protease family protein [Zea mays]|eukprot:XP_008674331.1 aspartic proteinase nepenthesin-1 [Zea mays]